MPNSQSFTVKSNPGGRLRDLRTQCGASLAFEPLRGGEHPKVINYVGLWDTGATGSVISSKVVAELGLKPIGKAKSYHANGESDVNVYIINIYLPNQVAFPFIRVTEGVLNGFDLLIGMDIITSGDFSITNVGGNTTFSFRVPSLNTIDYVADHMTQAQPAQVAVSQSQNSLCHCGSGKKYKRCHGSK